MYTLEQITKGVFQVQGEVTMQHNQINAIKMVRTITGCGLREAKEAVEAEIKRQYIPNMITLDEASDWLEELPKHLYDDDYCDSPYDLFDFVVVNVDVIKSYVTEIRKAVKTLENQ